MISSLANLPQMLYCFTDRLEHCFIYLSVLPGFCLCSIFHFCTVSECEFYIFTSLFVDVIFVFV